MASVIPVPDKEHLKSSTFRIGFATEVREYDSRAVALANLLGVSHELAFAFPESEPDRAA